MEERELGAQKPREHAGAVDHAGPQRRRINRGDDLRGPLPGHGPDRENRNGQPANETLERSAARAVQDVPPDDQEVGAGRERPPGQGLDRSTLQRGDRDPPPVQRARQSLEGTIHALEARVAPRRLRKGERLEEGGHLRPAHRVRELDLLRRSQVGGHPSGGGEGRLSKIHGDQNASDHVARSFPANDSSRFQLHSAQTVVSGMAESLSNEIVPPQPAHEPKVSSSSRRRASRICSA